MLTNDQYTKLLHDIKATNLEYITMIELEKEALNSLKKLHRIRLKLGKDLDEFCKDLLKFKNKE